MTRIANVFSAVVSVATTAATTFVDSKSGNYIRITDLIVANESATNSAITVYSGTATGTNIGVISAPANGGNSHTFHTPMSTAVTSVPITIKSSAVADAITVTGKGLID